ncbi:alpha/beta fold hydrolase [Sphingomonas mesophila]|uniref:alpha/beta fold hydrolase n=1 Tax=Sphingomonas mesophila TaxID=2303576 RepID=UPI000E57CB45|nr:alpha/beta fold hydrolase [Sphingomonas mesophila]
MRHAQPTPDQRLEDELDPDLLPPPDLQKWSELAWRLPRLLAGLGHLGPRGPENGPPALVIPGFLANDRSTMDLRRALALGGWRAHPWLLGLNRGARSDTMDLLAGRIAAIHDGRKVLLVGWSLGGMFARELAWRVPDKIRAVVTLGSPFSGDYKTNTNIREYYERIAGHDVNLPPFERHAGKPPVPMLAFWSRLDGIVAPAAARGAAGEVDKAVELTTRHAGFALDRGAMSRIVREIRIFLREVEGRRAA